MYKHYTLLIINFDIGIKHVPELIPAIQLETSSVASALDNLELCNQ